MGFPVKREPIVRIRQSRLREGAGDAKFNNLSRLVCISFMVWTRPERFPGQQTRRKLPGRTQKFRMSRVLSRRAH